MSAVNSLFHRWPDLVGFSVQDAGTLPEDREWIQLEGGLALADIDMHEWVGDEDKLEIVVELAAALLELIEERPDAPELLRGRTFARTLH